MSRCYKNSSLSRFFGTGFLYSRLYEIMEDFVILIKKGGNLMDKKMKDVITTHLMKELNPAFIIVFGSFAKGTQRNDSDLDLAFYPEDRTNPPTPYQLFIIAQELAEKVKREVDLMNLQTASTVFGAQIFHTGEVLI